MIKRILKIWFTIAMYELGKCIGKEVYYKLTANDEVEVPKDFDENDHAHLNELWKRYLNDLVDSDYSSYVSCLVVCKSKGSVSDLAYYLIE